MSRSSASPLRAIFFALAGFTFWVGGDTFMKLAAERQIPPYEIMTIGGFGGLISIFTVSALRGNLRALRPRKHSGLIALGIMFFMNYVLWLKGLAHLPLANFYTILFLAPTVVAFVAARILKETLDWKKIAAIIAGFIGVVIAVNPQQLFSDRGDWVSYGAVFIGMMVVVTQQLTLRFMGGHESREATAFYPRFGAIIGGLILTAVHGFVPIDNLTLLYSLMTGAVGGMGWVFMAYAYNLAPASTIAPFHYSQIVSCALMGFLIWHDVPTPHVIAGAAIIILSGLYIARHTHRAARVANLVADTP